MDEDLDPVFDVNVNNNQAINIINNNKQDLSIDVNNLIIKIGGKLIYNDQIMDVQNLLDEIKEIHIKINEIYYAPGMPGFIKAQQNFETVLNKRKRN